MSHYCIQKEGKSYKDTTAYNEWKHVGYTTHQMRIDLMSHTVIAVLFRILCLISSGCMINRCISCTGLLHQFLCLMDSVCHLGINKRLTIKAVHRNLSICCHNNTLGSSDLAVCQNILGSAGSTGLNLDTNTKFLSSLFNCLCCHISMSNTCGAGCNSNHIYRTGCSALCCSSLLTGLLCLIDNG